MKGVAGFLAPWYHALAPMPPSEVRRMRPSEVASVLGLDRQLAVVSAARALLDGEFVDLNPGLDPNAPPTGEVENLWTPPSVGQNEAPPAPPAGGQRLRKVY